MAWLGFTTLSAFAVPLIFMGNFHSCGATIPTSLGSEYFSKRMIKIVNLKPCNFLDAGKLMRHLNIERGLYTKILRTVGDLDAMEDIPLYDTPSRVGILIDLSCEENRKFIAEASAAGQFGLRWSWLIDAGADMGFLQTVNLGFVNDVTIVRYNTTNIDRFELFHAYTSVISQHLITEAVGHWTKNDGLSYSSPVRNYSMEGKSVKAAILVTQDIYHDDEIYNELQNKTYMPSLDSANRYYYAVNLHIADLFNYSIKLVTSNDWGVQQPNGSFSGMFGLLAGGSADMLNSPARVVSERMTIASPLLPIQQFLFPFIFKQPKRTGTYKALALQFRLDVWVFGVLIASTAILTLSAIHWLRNTMKRRRGQDVWRSEEESLSYNAIFVIGTVSQQGLMNNPPDFPRRIASFFLLFCCLMLSTYYNAATMNALLSPSPNSIKNIKDLLASDVPLALHDAPYFSHPHTRKVVLDQALSDRVDYFNIGLLSLEQGLQLILKGGAFCAEDFTLYKGIESTFRDELKCDLSIIQSSRPFPTSFWVSKKSPYREIMFRGYWYPSRPHCLVNQQWLFVGLEAVSIALAIITGGFLFSLIVFIVELGSTLSFFRKPESAVTLK